MKLVLAFVLAVLLIPGAANAQFTGPVVDRAELTVDEVREVRVGTYAVVTGQIINRIREDYYTFRDDTGEIRAEIEPNIWKNRSVGPETIVRLVVEVDSNMVGRRYLWVESMEIVEPQS
jgi:uncharacterized protein (TIGR00156 family)